MRFHLFIIISSILLVNTSCKKDKPDVNSDKYANSLFIDGSSVTVTNFTNTSFDEIDVDGNGSPDFGFDISLTPGNYSSTIYEVKMTSLHFGARMLLHVPSDTLYSGVVTTKFRNVSLLLPNNNSILWPQQSFRNLCGYSLHSESS